MRPFHHSGKQLPAALDFVTSETIWPRLKGLWRKLVPRETCSSMFPCICGVPILYYRHVMVIFPILEQTLDTKTEKNLYQLTVWGVQSVMAGKPWHGASWLHSTGSAWLGLLTSSCLGRTGSRREMLVALLVSPFTSLFIRSDAIHIYSGSSFLSQSSLKMFSQIQPGVCVCPAWFSVQSTWEWELTTVKGHESCRFPHYQ